MENRAKQAAESQVAGASRTVGGQHKEKKVEKQAREERLVIRLSREELRRINKHCELVSLPVSTWARAELLSAVRRG